MSKKSVHIIYKGNVQGVGFRFTTVRVAEQNDISGWVKNLPGGDVEVAAEGEREDLGNFISSLESRMSAYIKNKQTDWQDFKNQYSGFDVKY